MEEDNLPEQKDTGQPTTRGGGPPVLESRTQARLTIL